MANFQLPINSRIDWIDYAKGICIFAVITLYATREVQDITHVKGWMQHAVDFAQPFRMPDFFLIAGLLVPRVIDRPWRRYLDTKVLYFVYFYAVWVTFSFVYREAHQLLGPDRLALLPDYLRLFYAGPPYGPLWFIYILALFFIVVRLLRSWPVPLVLAGAVALEAAHLHTGAALLDRFALYFIFFYSGYMYARHILRLADWAQAHRRRTLGLFALWFAANAILVSLDLGSAPGMPLLMGYAGAVAVMLLATLLARVSWMRWLRYLGRHSIVVYLGFIIPLRVLLSTLVERKVIDDTGTLSLLVTLGSVAGAVLLYWVLRNTPLRFLYSRPAWTSIQTGGELAPGR